MGLFDLRRKKPSGESERKQHSVELSLKFERVVLLDQIVEFSSIPLWSGDSLEITWHITMQARVDRVKTDQMRWDSKGMFYCKADQVMRFARYSYLNGKSLVRVYEKLPELPELPAE